ncbi:DUF5017 domain-containing protein [Pedobacter sp. BS3]|uniref:DUF5017 domain-containing protein n=1 Tax=Pedobacter sp. BS3 TaxID=2567937 RepID=UPI0011EE29BA|nr:DUF5017 domain-containing protein [Pedobacter sp. BS3]TZF81832.1 DUF5017 domain-containing protein [Pedobacter sp. BS3]
MNSLKYIIGIAAILSFSYCRKDVVEEPSFNVTTDKTEYHVGDSVTFKFSGYADVIGFYSGETGKEYRYKDRTEVTDSKLLLNISTQVLYASQANNLHLMYSTDFNGKYTVDGLQTATWTEITDRFTLSTAAANGVGTVTPSGDVDLSDLPVSGKPIYFAWKYTAQASATAALGGRTWRIPVFNLTSKTAGGSTATLATVTTAGWIAIDVLNTANKWTIQSTTPYLYFAPAGTLNASEDWVITGMFFPNKVTPDVGAGIKTYLDTMKDYKYAFNQAGTYTVTFVANNANNNGQKTVVKQLTLTIQ